MKRIGLFCLIGLFVIVGGVFMINYRGERLGEVIGPPEGYEEPAGKVKRLKIGGSVSKYYDDNIDLVAFGPGSGWLKLKTGDGLSPTLSFNRVSQKDIQRFNQFSRSLGLPIRAEFSDNVLSLSAVGEETDSIYVADITEEKIGADSIMNTGPFQAEEAPRLAIRKDGNGKVFLVAVDKMKGAPDHTPEEEEIVVARKEKE
ncbi:MAG: hypothetical protein JRC68_07085 [Deltaproteobacteria bacterium]|nr:hypothetical protein [Deltaproteobacteria bacterium]